MKDIFNLIGYDKLQQIILIKILFLTGSLGFVEPNSIFDIKETVKINEEFLSSEISELLIFEKAHSVISEKKAQEILDIGEFESKEKAYHWINSILKRKFALEKEKTLKEISGSKLEKNLTVLLDEFDSTKNFPNKQKFDSVIIIDNSTFDLNDLLGFSANFLKDNYLFAENFYLISSEESKNSARNKQRYELLNKYFPQKHVNSITVINKNISVKDKFLGYAKKSLNEIPSRFFKQASKPKILIISAEDFPRYQLAVYKSIFPKEATFSIISFRPKNQKNIASILESFSVELGMFEDLILKK